MRRWTPVLMLMTALALLPALPRPACAQNPPMVTSPSLPPIGPEPQLDPKLVDRQIRERQAQREKQLKADAAKLLALAQRLKSSVDSSDKNVLSLQVVDTADQVEKLAKKIRDSMRDGR